MLFITNTNSYASKAIQEGRAKKIINSKNRNNEDESVNQREGSNLVRITRKGEEL